MKRIILFAMLFVLCTAVSAQDRKENIGSQGKNGSGASATGRRDNPANSTSTRENTAQPNNLEYTESIIKNTTDKMFLTEIVDHLPASETVPSPDKVLGYPVGTPNKLTYTKDQYRYYRELEKASGRVRTFVAPEKSEQGREQLLIAISDEANIARLAQLKEITAKLADPRRINDEIANNGSRRARRSTGLRGRYTRRRREVLKC